MKHNLNTKGFTLIEMAVVLVIIGLILAAVMKGKDMIRNAQVREFTDNFVLAWEDIVYSYYDKKSQVLADGKDNGGNSTLSADGFFDDIIPASSSSSNVRENIVNATQAVGIDPCGIVKSDMEYSPSGGWNVSDPQTCGGIDVFQRTVAGEYKKSQVKVGFYSATTPLGTKNVLFFFNVPADVARGIDSAIDGHIGPNVGKVLKCDSATNCNSTSKWSNPTGGTTDNLGVVIDF